MNGIINTMIITLNHLESIARPSTLADVHINVLSQRINHMINTNCDLIDIIDMLDSQDSWSA